MPNSKYCRELKMESCSRLLQVKHENFIGFLPVASCRRMQTN